MSGRPCNAINPPSYTPPSLTVNVTVAMGRGERGGWVGGEGGWGGTDYRKSPINKLQEECFISCQPCGHVGLVNLHKDTVRENKSLSEAE